MPPEMVESMPWIKAGSYWALILIANWCCEVRFAQAHRLEGGIGRIAKDVGKRGEVADRRQARGTAIVPGEFIAMAARACDASGTTVVAPRSRGRGWHAGAGGIQAVLDVGLVGLKIGGSIGVGKI